jgi:PAS domain S-box-containing protein
MSAKSRDLTPFGLAERYRALFERSRDLVYLHDFDGRFFDANPAALNLLGYTREEMLALNFAHLLSPDQLPQALQAIEELKRTGSQSRVLEYRLQRKNGEVVEVETQTVVICRDGKPYAIQGIARDITERKQAEEELRESEERFRQLVHHMSGGVAVLEAINNGEDFLLRDFNRAAERMDHVRREDVLGRSLLESFPKLVGFGLFEVLQRVWRTGLPEHHSVPFYQDQHITSWHENYVYKLPTGEIVAIYDDVTERKRAEEQTKEFNERFQIIARATNDTVWDWNLATNALWWNEGICSVFGYSTEEIELTIDSWYQRLHPDDRDRVVSSVHAVIANGGQSWSSEYRFRRADRSYAYVLDRGFVIRDEQGKAIRMAGAMLDITERKRADEALRESEERYRSLFENMLEGFAYCRILFDDRDRPVGFSYLAVNSAFKRLAGPKEVVGKPVSEVIPGIKELSPELFEACGRVALTGQPEQFEFDFKSLGSWLFISVYSTEKGYFVAVFEDITKRKRAEEALHDSETLLNDVGEMARVGGWEFDVATQDMRWTREIYRIYEIPEGEEIELARAINFFDLPDRSTLEGALQRCMEQGEPFDLELPFRSASGRHLWTRALGSAVKSCGKVVKVMGTFQDITERKLVEEEREALLKEMRVKDRAIESSINAIAIADREGILSYVNPAFLHLWGFADQQEVVGKSATVFLQSPEQASRVIQALQSDGNWSGEMCGIRKMDGMLFDVEVAASQVKGIDGNPLGMICAFQDISERKRGEQTRTDMIRTVAHDLSNPIAAIQATMELIPPHVKATMTRYTEVIERNVMRLGQLTQNLLDAARIGAGELHLNKEAVNLAVLVAETCRAEETLLAGKNQHLELALPVGPVPIQGDRGKLEEVLANLLGNAYKFAPKDSAIRIHLAVEGEEAVLSVSDDGPGIATKHLPHLFDRFYRVDQNHGSGLGLFIAKWIVEAHGGTIAVRSEVGHGSTFTVRLPLASHEMRT